MLTQSSILEAIVLVFALSIDAFVASFAYGNDHIKIPYSSILIISLICSIALGISLTLGIFIRPMVSETLIKWICFLLLFSIGVCKVFDHAIKQLIRKHQKLHRQMSFSFFQLRVLLQVYADPQVADFDHSRSLSKQEALLLAISLSVDGLAAGFSAGLTQLNLWFVLAFSFICGSCMVMSGSKLGNHLSAHTNYDIAWLSGYILIILAICKVI